MPVTLLLVAGFFLVARFFAGFFAARGLLDRFLPAFLVVRVFLAGFLAAGFLAAGFLAAGFLVGAFLLAALRVAFRVVFFFDGFAGVALSRVSTTSSARSVTSSTLCSGGVPGIRFSRSELR